MFCLTHKLINSVLTRFPYSFQCLMFLLPIVISHKAQGMLYPPVDISQSANVSYDKSALPADYYLFRKLVNGYDTTRPGILFRFGSRMGIICNTTTSYETGACTTDRNWYSTEPTRVKLRFTEKRSKVSAIVELIGYSEKGWIPISGCGSWTSGTYNLASARSVPCTDRYNNVTGFTIYIPSDQFGKIPSGGIWEATLVLDQGNLKGDTLEHVHQAYITYNITLDVTDKNNGAVYLPAFGRAAPLVDLNLRTKPLSTAPGGEVSGSTVIDTCLYDGYNSNSPWLKVTLSDLLAPAGRAADLFSVVKSGAANSQPVNRVDYRVTLDYNGQPIKMDNGKEVTLSGVNTDRIRPVMLPGIPVPVVCTPAPLKLDVLPFAKASKTAGRYQGTLRINLSATALAP